MKVFYEERKCILEGKELTYKQLYTVLKVNDVEIKCELKAERNTKEMIVNSIDECGYAKLIGQLVDDKYLLFATVETFYGETTVPLDNKSMDNFRKEIIYYSLSTDERF